jgi:hypothetical protein
MNVDIGTEATLFPEKEYINGIFFAVCISRLREKIWAPKPLKKLTWYIQQGTTWLVHPQLLGTSLQQKKKLKI